MDNTVLVVFAFELERKGNKCEHKLEHVTNQLWMLVNWNLNRTEQELEQ